MNELRKQFKIDHPETIGETDQVFDDGNYIEWLEKKYIQSQEDSKILDWLQGMMTDDNDYCEIYLAGLRDFSNGKANRFQIESNPQKFEVTNAESLRAAITKIINNRK